MIVGVLILLLASILSFLWLRGGCTILGYDAGFRLQGLPYIEDLVHSWNHTLNYGADWSIYRAFSVLQYPESLLTSLTGSLQIAQSVTFVGWFLIMGLSMYALLRTIFPESKFFFFRIFSSVLYVFNFFILNGWLNAERAKFSLYAALPIAILLLYRQAFHRTNSFVNAICFGLTYAILNGGGSPPLFGATLVVLACAIIVFLIGVWRQRGIWDARKLLGIYALFGVAFICFNAYWLLPLAGLASGSYASSVAGQGGIGGLIEWEKVFSQNASFLNIFRLQGFPDWVNNPLHPYASVYGSNLILVLMSFIPVLSILLGVVRFGVKDAKRSYFLMFLLILLCIGTVMTAGSHPPTGKLYILLMRYVPGFAVFRSSFFKFAPSVWLPVIILFGYYLSIFVETHCKKNNVRQIIWILCIVGILAYHYPFFTTKGFEINKQFASRVQVPSYVYEMKNSIEQKTTVDDRILILPELDAGYITLPMDAYTWGFYSADILPRVLTNRSFVANDATDDAITKLLYASFYAGDTTRFQNLASIAGVTHILWRGDIALSDERKLGRIDEFQLLSTLPVIKKIDEVGKWQLYTMNASTRPMIVLATNPLFVSGVQKGDVLFADDTVTLRDDAEQIDKSSYIGAECVMCDPDEFTKFESGIYLPPVSGGNSRFKQLLLSKNISTTNKTDGAVIDEELSESMMFLSKAVMTNDIDSAYKALRTFDQIVFRYEGLAGRTKIIYANRLYAYMLAMERLSSSSGVADVIVSGVAPFKERIQSDVYMSDQSTFRYLVRMPVSGNYYIHGSVSLPSLLVDGIPTYGSSVTLSNGLHTIEIPRVADESAPYIFIRNEIKKKGSVSEISYKRVSPTKYTGMISERSVESTVLVFNQRFDRRWKLTLTSPNGAKKIIRQHFEANGYANGWIIDQGFVGTFEITYESEKLGVVGWTVSFASLLLAGVFGIVISIRTRIIRGKHL